MSLLTPAMTPSGIALLLALAGLVAVVAARASVGLRRRARNADIRRIMRFVEPSAAAFWIADARTNRNLYVSPAYSDLWGIDADALRADAQAWTTRIHPEDLSAVRAAFARLRERHRYDAVFRISMPDGQVRWIHDTAWTVTDARGRVSHLAGASQDITERWRMRAALVESEDHYRNILDHAPLGIHELDAQGRFLTVNAAGLRRCNARTLDELAGRPFLDFIEAPEQGAVATLLEQALAGRPSRFEFRSTPDAEGHRPLCESCFIPVRDPRGHISRLIGITEDISARRDAEERQRESEMRFRIVADHISEVFWLDAPDGHTIYANRAFEHIWGRTVEELQADPTLWIRSIHPDDRIPAAERMPLLERDGRHEFEYRIRRPDGEIRWIHERAAAVRDDHGRLEFIAGTSTDITARRQAEEERETTRRHIAHLLRTADAVLASPDERQALERIADGVHGAGWNTVIVTLYDQWRVAHCCTRGLTPEQYDHFNAHRPNTTRRIEMFGDSFRRFRVGRSYLIPGARDRINSDDLLRSDAPLPDAGPWQEHDLAYIPLRSPAGAVIGSIYINQPADGRRPDTETIRPLEFFADLAARVIDGLRAEQRQTRLMRELNHRVRNNLGVVLALSQLTRRSTTSLDEFMSTFEGRILTLARTHETLARNDWKGADINELLGVILGAHMAQVELCGPALTIDSDAITPLCMTLHELTTNAVKHGALSSTAGRVSVTWSSTLTDTLELQWRESGGPSVSPPTTTGYGTGLIRGFIEHDLAGHYEAEFRPEGFRIRIHVPRQRPVIVTRASPTPENPARPASA